MSKAKPRTAKKVVKVDETHQAFYDELQVEGERRMVEIREKIEDEMEQLMNSLKASFSATFSEEFRNMNLMDALKMVGEDARLSKAAQPSKQVAADKPPATAAAVKIEKKSTIGVKDQGPSSSSAAAPSAPIVDTVRRPPMNKQAPFQHLNLVTPAGKPMRVPAMLPLKVDDLTATRYRTVRAGEEIGFSLDGSPIVLGDAAAPDPSNIIKDMLNTDENSLTPASRELTANIKLLLRKKAEDAEAAQLAKEID